MGVSRYPKGSALLVEDEKGTLRAAWSASVGPGEGDIEVAIVYGDDNAFVDEAELARSTAKLGLVSRPEDVEGEALCSRSRRLLTLDGGANSESEGEGGKSGPRKKSATRLEALS